MGLFYSLVFTLLRASAVHRSLTATSPPPLYGPPKDAVRRCLARTVSVTVWDTVTGQPTYNRRQQAGRVAGVNVVTERRR